MILPKEEDVYRVLGSGVELSAEAADNLKAWREQYPRPACGGNDATPSGGGEPSPEHPTNSGDNAADPNAQPLAQVGTKASKQDLENKYKQTLAACKPLPGNNPKAAETLELVLGKSQDGNSQVWIHSKSTKEQTHSTGLFLG